MRTVVLHAGGFDPTIDGYPVTLLEMTALGNTPVLATGVLPSSLQPSAGPIFSADEMRKRFAAAGQPDESLTAIGAQLYALLAPGAIDAHLQTLDRDARVVLTIEPPELQLLPWELLCRNQLFLFPNASIPFCRGVGHPLASLPDHDWPLRLLVIVGAKEAAATPQADEVQAEAELEYLGDALVGCEADIDFLVLKRQSKAEIVRQLRKFQPHILHFIGHGGINLDKVPFLLLHNEQAKINEFWEPTVIRNDLLGLEKTLRLAFLNACRSDAAGQDGLWSVTNAFLEAGVPAVLGMHTEIAGDDAGRFAGAFYQMLASGKSVDVAVAEARRRVHEPLQDGLKRREWASPCLQVQAAPESILRVGIGVKPALRQELRTIREFKSTRRLVDRRDERREAWHDLSQKQHSLLVITGDDRVGKTRFAHMLMERCALADHELCYLDMKEHGGDYLTLLRAIRDGHSLLSEPLTTPPNGFTLFNRLVNQTLSAPIPPGSSPDDDLMAPVIPAAFIQSQARQLFQAFRSGLEQVAALRPPLVLVLDHLDLFPANQFTDYLNPYLLQWGSNHPDLRIILLLTEAQYRDFELDEFKDDFAHIPIRSFERALWVELAMEFVRRNTDPKRFPNEEQKRAYFSKAKNSLLLLADLWMIHGDWKPDLLERLRSPT